MYAHLTRWSSLSGSQSHKTSRFGAFPARPHSRPTDSASKGPDAVSIWQHMAAYVNIYVPLVCRGQSDAGTIFLPQLLPLRLRERRGFLRDGGVSKVSYALGCQSCASYFGLSCSHLRHSWHPARGRNERQERGDCSKAAVKH